MKCLNIFSDLLTLTKLIVIVGDFNINLLSSSSSVTNYTNLLSDFQFTQHVTAPSRVTNCSATLIDHLLVYLCHTPVKLLVLVTIAARC